jgi:hypothetical protein
MAPVCDRCRADVRACMFELERSTDRRARRWTCVECSVRWRVKRVRAWQQMFFHYPDHYVVRGVVG